MTTAAASDGRARAAAKRVGLKATKTRWRRDSVDNQGGFQLVDSNRNMVVAGSRYDMTADQVIAFCAERRV